MKYFLDTEFLEGPQKRLFGYTKPTIDLISIGIVAEDGREYYAVSKDFNLREAWNRYDLKQRTKQQIEHTPALGTTYKDYWIRENVLKPVFAEWNRYSHHKFNYQNMKYCIKMVGKSNQQIAKEIKDFVSLKSIYGTNDTLVIEGMSSVTRKTYEGRMEILRRKNDLPEFYGYFADYDWVCFAWLFGKMIDLPKGFPMYCKDLKQMLDEKSAFRPVVFKDGKDLNDLKEHPDYPKQTNEHHALSDARWNKELHKFIEKP